MCDAAITHYPSPYKRKHINLVCTVHGWLGCTKYPITMIKKHRSGE